MDSQNYIDFCEWLKKPKHIKWKNRAVASFSDGITYFTCVYCQYSGSITKQGNSWCIANFTRHLNKQTLECPDRKHVSELLSSSSSSSADQIMETDDVSSILS